ncbi:hypothetical protein [uncultured Croceitalea sp.]|uniref:hypothetical protein n=1 Tax=uncultured Croceitalea sp. TaxID=1798908 RepID=UPI00374E7A76
MKKILLLLSLFSIISCSNDDEQEATFQGTEQEITQIFNEEVFETLRMLQFTINQGAEPPNLEGMFFASPFILTDTNIPEDQVGTRTSDFRFEFSNQDNATNTIDFSGASINFILNEVRETFSGAGSSFISGNNNDFSVFSIIEGQNEATGSILDLAYVLSGIISDEGILSLELAIIILDDRGDSFDIFIENGQGRKFIDEDGLSEAIDANDDIPSKGTVTAETIPNLLSGY